MTETDFIQFLDRLRCKTRSNINSYRSQWDSPVPITMKQIMGQRNQENQPIAGQEFVRNIFNICMDLYDDIFDVDSSKYREAWSENLRYNPSKDLILSDIRKYPIRFVFTLSAINGGYSQYSGIIGISHSTLTEPKAACNVSSELAHAYQDAFDSNTDFHPLLGEGIDIGMRTLALEHFANVCGYPELRRVAAAHRVHVLVTGYASIIQMQRPLEEPDLKELGLSDEEISHIKSGRLGQWGGTVAPPFRWTLDDITYQYNIGGAIIIIGQEIIGNGFVSSLFHNNDHPWTGIVEELSDSTLRRPSVRMHRAGQKVFTKLGCV